MHNHQNEATKSQDDTHFSETKSDDHIAPDTAIVALRPTKGIDDGNQEMKA